jgi:hypothetical protein
MQKEASCAIFGFSFFTLYPFQVFIRLAVAVTHIVEYDVASGLPRS